MAYQAVARVEDIPAQGGLCVCVGGVDIGLFRVAEDIYAIENRCPHAGDPLNEGTLEGTIVTCRAHGWQFDLRTGFRPSDADGFPIPRFAVRVVAGAVEVDIEAPLNVRARRRRSAP